MTSKLLSALNQMTADLDQLGAEWALVGGLAVAVHAEPRTTRDVDLAVAVADDRSCDRLVRALRELGWIEIEDGTIFRRDSNQLAVLRMRNRKDGEDGAVVDLLFNATGIEREIVARAERVSILPSVEVQLVTLGDLMAMKVLARNENRPHDTTDLRSLAARATPETLEKAREALRLIQKRMKIVDRDLTSELDDLLVRFAEAPAI